jgi:hypothetical protein
LKTSIIDAASNLVLCLGTLLDQVTIVRLELIVVPFP